MDLAQFRETPHRRFNPLSGEWVQVSPHRTQRPWQGKVESVPPANQAQYDPNCYLCPGNARAGAAVNPQYDSTFVFDNDYAALLPNISEANVNDHDLLIARTERGICRVGCFSPRHDLTIARMTVEELRLVVDMWTDQYRQLAAIPWIIHVQIFENRGVMMGASNPHPHCQIWANETMPNQPAREQQSLTGYREKHSSCLLCDYIRVEASANQRIVCENQSFVALVPFWAIWPFETMIISKRHFGSMNDMADDERTALGEIIKRVTTRYDNLFQVSFPYSMGFHQAPTDGEPHPEWHVHAHYYPPLLRSATIQKFMVGYELLGTPQRDITPESAAERLRELSTVHYLDRT
ncbi:MAG: UDP-glucose--hexose-1-phosphate uridylyltransferase [Thermoanaerobaculia bacterium]